MVINYIKSWFLEGSSLNLSRERTGERVGGAFIFYFLLSKFDQSLPSRKSMLRFRVFVHTQL